MNQLIANVVWPGLAYTGFVSTFWIVACSLVTEAIALWLILKISLWKSVLVSIGVNAFSTIIGLVCFPMVGLRVEQMAEPYLGEGTFNWTHLYANYFVILVITVLLEVFFFWLAFPKLWNRKAWWVMGAANALTVWIAFFYTMDHIYPQ